MIFRFPQYGFGIIDGFFCFLGLWVFLFSGFMGSVQLCLGFWILELEFKGFGIASFVLILGFLLILLVFELLLLGVILRRENIIDGFFWVYGFIKPVDV